MLSTNRTGKVGQTEQAGQVGQAEKHEQLTVSERESGRDSDGKPSGESPPVGEALGRVIRYLREGRGMTQKELGDVSGVHYVTVSRVELATGSDVKFGTLERLAKGLGTNPAKVWMAAGALVTGEAELWKSLERYPVEDGMVHPGEGVLVGIAGTLGVGTGPWLVDLVVSGRRGAREGSALLTLIGRMRPGLSLKWKKQLVYWGLTHPDAEMRDAAVGIVEEGEREPELIELLKGHREPVEWLREYIEGVVAG